MRSLCLLCAVFLAAGLRLSAQTGPYTAASTPSASKGQPIEITADGETNYVAGIATAQGNVIVHYGTSVLYADRVSYDSSARTALADGNVRIYVESRVYRGDHIVFNFETKSVISSGFSIAAFPAFAKAESATTPGPDHYHITNGSFTTENREHPTFRIKAHTIEIYPDDRVVFKNVSIYVGDVPVLWLPVYAQSLKSESSTFTLRGGATSRFGPEVLATVNWKASDAVEASFHADYREKRGPAGGIDIAYKPPTGGMGQLRTYYTNDQDYTENPTIIPRAPISEDRYLFSYQQITPFPDGLTAKLNANVWSDPYITQDFFPNNFGRTRMPDNTVEVADTTPDFELSVMGRVQANRFFDTTDRAPEFRAETKPIKLFGTPVEYETENSMVNFIQQYSDQRYYYGSIPKDYSSYRWDSYQQLLYPKQYFNWLTVTPHVGARATAWSSSNAVSPSLVAANNAKNPSLTRFVADAGADLSFKLSRTWTDSQDKKLAIDGIRHVFEPFVSLEGVLPSKDRNDLRGFDTRVPNTWANPIDFPQWNSVDSIDRQLVVRQGVRNSIQTKRDGQNWSLIDWSLFSDLNLTRHYDEQQVYTNSSYQHVYSEATFRPFPWMHLDSRAAVDVSGHSYNMLDHSVTWQPDRSYEVSLGDRMLENVSILDSYGIPIQNSNLIYVRNFYRMNEHWQFENLDQFNSETSRLEEQAYTVYRDLSAWQVSVTVADRNNQYGADEQLVYFTLTLKAFPAANVRIAD